ncbi:MAG: glutamine amidotransferase [Planctomycetes bacterium]|nr:glutamine amidotransferase [Planctomycetota bacterium]
MKSMWIIKAGRTFTSVCRAYGDFEQWISGGLGSDVPRIRVFDVARDIDLPTPRDCSGVIVTGSHAMVTDRLPWSLALEDWIPRVVESDVPFLGICYGHQLLASALGGEVAYHPRGREVGTVGIRLSPACADDPLLGGLPQTFDVNVLHAQTVARLPAGAVHLACNNFEQHHAFRVGPRAWGVQFHPEYDDRIMSAYIERMAGQFREEGHDVEKLSAAVRPTPEAARVLTRFADLVNERGL